MVDNAHDFFSESDLNRIKGPKIAAHYILWASLGFIIIMFLWAYSAYIDEVTRGIGKVIPSSEIQVVQNLEGGIIKKILAKEGAIVEKNQILIEIDDTRFASSYNQSLAREFALKAKLIRLNAEANGKVPEFPNDMKQKFPEIIDNEMALYEAKQEELEAHTVTLQKQINQRKLELQELHANKNKVAKNLGFIKEELAMTRPLLEEGAVSKVEVLRLERQENTFDGDLKTINIAIPRLQNAVEIAINKTKELNSMFKTEALDELSDVKAEYAPLMETKTALQDRVDRTNIRSPVRGTVKKLHVTTIGGVVQPGMDLIEIVPLDDSLLIEAQIKPSDIGFLHPGQKVMVKITAYDYSIYGGLTGTVEHIGADTITNERENNVYEILVRTAKNNLVDKSGKPLVIIPGMTASVDILTGKKTILAYLLKPVLKAKQKALTER